MLKFVRSQPVLLAAFIAAAISAFFVPPDARYGEYMNLPVLTELFALMAAVAGLRSAGLFERATGLITRRAKDIRTAGLFLIILCMLSAAVVTNDVALITFVPLTLLIFGDTAHRSSLILIIVLETAAANLGGMLTPVGNPQNLFLYDRYSLTPLVFISTMLPAGILCLAVLLILTLLLPKAPYPAPKTDSVPLDGKKAAVFGLLFIICLLTVFKVIPFAVCLAAALLLSLAADRKVLLRVDYPLLVTFVFFFVFSGNIARVDSVNAFLSSVLTGRETAVSAAVSQFISNVPAAVMLSGFTEKGTLLLKGVNIGGFGTPVASLASLISLQFYRKSAGSDAKRFMLIFSAVNFGLLFLLLAADIAVFSK